MFFQPLSYSPIRDKELKYKWQWIFGLKFGSVQIMRKILWAILFFCAYIWVVTSGNDGFVLEQAKSLYNSFISWFDDAEIDYNVKIEHKNKRKSRRWD